MRVCQRFSPPRCVANGAYKFFVNGFPTQTVKTLTITAPCAILKQSVTHSRADQTLIKRRICYETLQLLLSRKP